MVDYINKKASEHEFQNAQSYQKKLLDILRLSRI